MNSSLFKYKTYVLSTLGLPSQLIKDAVTLKEKFIHLKSLFLMLG